MDLLYSVSLMVALVAGAVGASVAAFTLWRPDVSASPKGLRRRVSSIRVAVGALALGALSLVISAAVHRWWGHGPASAAPMDVARFIFEHEAFVVVAVVLVIGFALAAHAARRRTARGPA